MEKQNYDEALVLYKNSLACCLRVLGPNHPHTAEVYLEIGKLYLTMEIPNEAMVSLEKSHAIYTASLGEFSLSTINAGFNLA
mmetsp:Transcript_15443/g.2580  ORF Transcript_15443/g.2580 Transcript_15443/m.2580 type:complete len:82 (+) Transcript_15443:2697-2942(+)